MSPPFETPQNIAGIYIKQNPNIAPLILLNVRGKEDIGKKTKTILNKKNIKLNL
nr:hypothetical protein [Clostridioides difficile]